MSAPPPPAPAPASGGGKKEIPVGAIWALGILLILLIAAQVFEGLANGLNALLSVIQAHAGAILIIVGSIWILSAIAVWRKKNS